MSDEEYCAVLKRYHIQQFLIEQLKELKVFECRNISASQRTKIELAVAQIGVADLVKLYAKYTYFGKNSTAILILCNSKELLFRS